ncbi:MAG: type II secretion system protein [Verrucomicrobia bacterium]|nr:type II secretion system protein [Verrucomicrobiota bacterium]
MGTKPITIPRGFCQRQAFTLIELLTVIGVIAILASMLIPALAGTRERMQRTTCRNNIRQFILATHLYGQDHNDRLPSGRSESTNPGDEHIPTVSTNTRAQLIAYGGDLKILSCPNWSQYFKKRPDWRFPVYGYVLGYNYLGGRSLTPWSTNLESANYRPWISPQTLHDDFSLALVTDPNNWSRGYATTFVPHSKRGFIFYGPPIDDNALDFTPADVPTPKNLGAQGGNVGLLDGSVKWKPIARMLKYRGTRLWNSDGAFAMW